MKKKTIYLIIAIVLYIITILMGILNNYFELNVCLKTLGTLTGLGGMTFTILLLKEL